MACNRQRRQRDPSTGLSSDEAFGPQQESWPNVTVIDTITNHSKWKFLAKTAVGFVESLQGLQSGLFVPKRQEPKDEERNALSKIVYPARGSMEECDKFNRQFLIIIYIC